MSEQTPPPPPPPQIPPPPAFPPPGAGGPGAEGPGAEGSGGRRRVVVAVAAVVALLVVVGAGALVAVRVLGGGGPDDAARDLLAAVDEHEPDFVRQCELISPKLRTEQFRVANATTCDAWVAAQRKNLAKNDKQRISSDEACTITFGSFRKDLESEVTIRKVTEKGERAAVSFRRVTRYDGPAAVVKDCLKGGKRTQSTDGTLNLRRFDGEWRLDQLMN